MTTSRGVLVSINVVRILFSVAQAVFLDILDSYISFLWKLACEGHVSNDSRTLLLPQLSHYPVPYNV